MQKIIITSTILSIIISLSSARVLTKNAKLASGNSSSSSQSLSQKNQTEFRISHKKVDKDEDSPSLKNADLKSMSGFASNNQIVVKQMDFDMKSPKIEMKKSHLSPMTKSENSSHKSNSQMFNAVQNHVVTKLNDNIRQHNEALMRQDTPSHNTSSCSNSDHSHYQKKDDNIRTEQKIVMKKETPSHNTSSCSNSNHSHYQKKQDDESVSNVVMDTNNLMKNAIAHKVQALKQDIQNGSVVLNDQVEVSRQSSNSSSLRTNSHATHSHATNETCNRIKDESSKNSEVIEETVIETHNQVLDQSVVESSHVSEVRDSREDSSEGAKIMTTLVGIIALVMLA